MTNRKSTTIVGAQHTAVARFVCAS